MLTGPGPDHYFRELPIDPTTGKPFRYFPKGLPFPVESLVYFRPDREYVAANTPLVAGSSVDLNLGGGRPVYDQYRNYSGWVWETASTRARTGWPAGQAPSRCRRHRQRSNSACCQVPDDRRVPRLVRFRTVFNSCATAWEPHARIIPRSTLYQETRGYSTAACGTQAVHCARCIG